MTSPNEKSPRHQPQPSRVRDYEDPSWDYGSPFTGEGAGAADIPRSKQAEFDAAPPPGTIQIH